MQTIIHIGAGEGSELEAYLATGAQHIVLIEAIPALASQLRKKAQKHGQVTVLEAAITPNTANNQLYEYNLQEASSLREPTRLKKLFPGLKTIKTHAVTTLTPEQLLVEYAPEPGQPATLVIQAPGEEHAILQALITSDQLKCFSHLTITANPEPLYEGGVSAKTIISTLTNYGYDVTDQSWQDPDWVSWALQRNPWKSELKIALDEKESLKAEREKLRLDNDSLHNKVEELTRALEAEKQEQEKLIAELEIIRQAKDSLAKNLDVMSKEAAELKQQVVSLQVAKDKLDLENNALKKENSTYLQERDEARAQRDQAQSAGETLKAERDKAYKERDQLKQEKDALNQEMEKLAKSRSQAQEELEQAKARIKLLEAEAATNTQLKSSVKQLQEKMEYFFNQQTLQLEQAANALGQHVSQTAENTARELEAAVALQYLAPSSAAISQSGLPKSVALEVANQLTSKSYDLIIEMGSGSTTHFLAQTLKSDNREFSRLGSNQKTLTQYVDASEEDLPKRIISFDHDRKRQKELGEKLTNVGLASYVNLQFAPLVPVQYNGREHLFYDCGIRLQQVAHLFDTRQARILILVNAEPTETGPEPSAALPAVLQYLSAHQLDIVVNTSTHQQFTDQWVTLLNERGLDHTQPKSFGAGQVQLITVNP